MNVTPHSWFTTCRTNLDRLAAHLHDLIDCPHDPDVPPIIIRRDDTIAKAATIGNDRDEDYATPPDFKVRGRTEPPDPTLAAVNRRITTITTAIRPLATLVADLQTETARLTVHDQNGVLLPPPEPIGHTRSNTGHIILHIPPSQFAATVHTHTGWAKAALWAISNRWLELEALPRVYGELSQDPQLPGRARDFGRRIERTLRRHDNRRRLTPGTVRCANPHGQLNHPSTNGTPICNACRAPLCPDPLVRGCRRRLSVRDANLNASACAACRKAKSRQEQQA